MARTYTPSITLTQDQKNKAMRLLHKKWQAHTAQKQILRAIYKDGYHCVFIRAGRKFGKNEIANYLSWRTDIQIDQAETYIIGSTAEDEKKIIWNNERLQNFGPYLNQKVDDTNLILTFPWGSFTQIDGCRNAKAGRGRTFDLVIFDEGKDQKKDYYDAAFPNLLAKNGIIVFIGTPPDEDDPDGDFYRALEQQAKESKLWKHFHFTSYDNPHVSKEWLDEQRILYELRGEGHIFEREYLAADVRGNSGSVFPMFDPDFHCRPLKVLLAELQKGINTGSVEFYAISDPGTEVFAVLFFAYNRETSQIYILDEIYEQDRYKTSTVPIWTDIGEKKVRLGKELDLIMNWDDVYDEAASWFEVEVFQHFGVRIRPTGKKRGRGKLMHVSLLKDAMTIPRGFQIANHCTNTIDEIKRFKDIHADKKVHTIDILRYFTDECGYEYQNVKERLIVEKHKLIRPRGVSLETDLARMEMQADPMSALTDFDFDVSDYGDIFGF